jgi:hypothetical protein
VAQNGVLARLLWTSALQDSVSELLRTPERRSSQKAYSPKVGE